MIKEDSRAELYRSHIIGFPKIMSFMTLAELLRWQTENNWGERRKREAREFINDFTIVNSDEKLCSIWAEIKSDAHKNGNPIHTADAWIAAVALLFDVPLVTHNRNDFINVDKLTIISEESKNLTS